VAQQAIQQNLLREAVLPVAATVLLGSVLQGARQTSQRVWEFEDQT